YPKYNFIVGDKLFFNREDCKISGSSACPIYKLKVFYVLGNLPTVDTFAKIEDYFIYLIVVGSTTSANFPKSAPSPYYIYVAQTVVCEDILIETGYGITMWSGDQEGNKIGRIQITASVYCQGKAGRLGFV